MTPHPPSAYLLFQTPLPHAVTPPPCFFFPHSSPILSPTRSFTPPYHLYTFYRRVQNSNAISMAPPFQRVINRERRAAAAENTPLLSTNANASNQAAGPAREANIQWRDTFEHVFPYAVPATWPLRLLAAFSIVCIVVSKVFAVVTPYAYKLAVDKLSANLVGGSGAGGLGVPYMAVALWVGSQVGNRVFKAMQDYSYAVVAATCTKRFSVDLFSHLQSLSLSWHLQRSTGEVTRVMDRGVSSIDTIVNTFVFTLFPTLLETSLVVTIFLRLGTPAIALTTLLTVVLYGAFTVVITQWRIKFRRDLIEADNAVSEKAVDTLLNYETVKMFGMENEESAAYEVLQTKYQDEYLWFRLTLNSLNFGQGFIQTIGLGVNMLLAAIAASKGQITPGDFVAINAYVVQLFQPLFFLGSSYRIITRAATDVEKCVALLKTEVTVQDKPGAVDLVMPSEDVNAGRVGKVEFRNVTFKYGMSTRGDAGGLKDISFVVEPGKVVALVGASGAGKSTIIRLLLRFYDVDDGSVFIDERDVREYSQTSLRREIGVVAQDTVLFNKSLRFNISYGKQDATDAEIYHAARSAALGPFIEKLPEKLDTVVGERGVRLSGGERQRVGSARCIIKAPGIVLLDEASSALDTFTEREIQANLQEVCKNRTTIVIAHRLSTVMMADEIIVLGKDERDETLGTIIERGTHRSLLEQEGVYAGMWKAQTTVEKEMFTKIIEGDATQN